MGSILNFRLSPATEESVHRTTGMTVLEISVLDSETISRRLEQKAGHRFDFDNLSDLGEHFGSGQIYPYVNRLITANEIEEGFNRG